MTVCRREPQEWYFYGVTTLGGRVEPWLTLAWINLDQHGIESCVGPVVFFGGLLFPLLLF